METIMRISESIHIPRGLGDLDDDYDRIVGLYEKLQFSTLEASDLAVDVLTFANNAFDFSLIIKKVHSRKYKVQGENQEEVELSSTLRSKEIIGFVYLTHQKNKGSLPSSTSELDIGIIIDPRPTKRLCKATIINPLSPTMYPAYQAFISAGFKQEGIRRGAHFDAFDVIWYDVAYLAVLDTEWCVRHVSADEQDPITIWEEMLNRHQREREEMDILSLKGCSGRKVKVVDNTMEAIQKAMVEWQIGYLSE